jgi:superfamily I DNA/RNA helicase
LAQESGRRPAARRLIELLHGVQPAQDCYLAFSTHFGTEIDCVLFSGGSIVIGEMKAWAHQVRAMMNGPWERVFGEESEIIEADATPYEQAKKQRSILAKVLLDHAARGGSVLPDRIHSHIRAGMVQCPRLDFESPFEPEQSPWWFAAGLDDFAQVLRRRAEEHGPLPAQLFDRLLRKIGAIRTSSPPTLAQMLEIIKPRASTPAVEAAALGSAHGVVLAGAGAGKTEYMARAISDRLNSGRSNGIFAISYTNRARNVLRDRTIPLLEPTVPDRAARFGTIHQFARSLTGQQHRRRLLPSTRRLRVIEAAAPEARASDDASDLLTRAINASDGTTIHWPHSWCAAAWEAVKHACEETKTTTFELMLLEGMDGIEHADLWFDEVFVDEFQDTNGLQYEMLRRLARRGVRLTVVGDAEQSIYSFAGAIPDALASFEREFVAERRFLPTNYRSARRIIDFANLLRTDDLQQQPHRVEEGVVRMMTSASPSTIASAIAEEIKQRCPVDIDPTAETPALESIASYDDFAILGRTKADLKAVEHALKLVGIPVSRASELKLIERPKVRELLQILLLCEQPDEPYVVADALGALGEREAARAIQTNARARRGASARELLATGDAQIDDRASRALDSVAAIAIESSALQGRITPIFERLLRPRLTVVEGSDRILSGIRKDVDALWLLAATTALDAPALIELVERDDGVGITGRAGVRLATVHDAKGDEWRTVFVANAGARAFPLPFATNHAEERRIMYVALTRARDELVLCVPGADGPCVWLGESSA